MSVRPPSLILVVDANIILSALRGVRTRGHLRLVNAGRSLCTSEETRDEVIRVLAHLDPGPRARELAETLFAWLTVVERGEYEALALSAADFLARAPASRTGSTADSHILALAWTLDADIWSHDRDFAGTGWPSWSSANLIDALADEAAH